MQLLIVLTPKTVVDQEIGVDIVTGVDISDEDLCARHTDIHNGMWAFRIERCSPRLNEQSGTGTTGRRRS